MGKTILFSPVGGTDPISKHNIYDGSMLHICRHMKPDKVIMYMSSEILAYHRADNRYEYCLDRLAEMQNRKMEYEVIEREELLKVQEFNYFFEEFKEVIENILATMEADDTLLLNVSSGTPAMKSGLLVLQTLEGYPAKLIQVDTPAKKMNEHEHTEYDVELLWELNEDNRISEKRCHEISCPSLYRLKQEGILRQHINAYDYQAALSVADTIGGKGTEEYYEMIKAAGQRLALDFSELSKSIKNIDFPTLPVRSSADQKYFEYALNLDIKLRKKEYADFIRALTPLIVDMFERILLKQCKININDYCTKQDKVRKWSAEKLKGTELLEYLNEEYNGEFRASAVYSDHIRILIQRMATDESLKKLVTDVREVEAKIRNLAAHEIVSVTDNSIEELTGFSGEAIMKKIKKLFHYTDMNIKEEYWNSYDDMNRKILNKIQPGMQRGDK